MNWNLYSVLMYSTTPLTEFVILPPISSLFRSIVLILFTLNNRKIGTLFYSLTLHEYSLCICVNCMTEKIIFSSNILKLSWLSNEIFYILFLNSMRINVKYFSYYVDFSCYVLDKGNFCCAADKIINVEYVIS